MRVALSESFGDIELALAESVNLIAGTDAHEDLALDRMDVHHLGVTGIGMCALCLRRSRDQGCQWFGQLPTGPVRPLFAQRCGPAILDRQQQRARSCDYRTVGSDQALGDGIRVAYQPGRLHHA